MTEDEKEEIWLSHLRANPRKWIALAGDYPHVLAGVGDDAVKAVEAAKCAGYNAEAVMLFMVPPPMPLCVTPFIYL
jgi:hypothetical protein